MPLIFKALTPETCKDEGSELSMKSETAFHQQHGLHEDELKSDKYMDKLQLIKYMQWKRLVYTFYTEDIYRTILLSRLRCRNSIDTK